MWQPLNPNDPRTWPDEDFRSYLAETPLQIGSRNIATADQEKLDQAENKEELIKELEGTNKLTSQVRTFISFYIGDNTWMDEVGMPVRVIRWSEFPEGELSLMDLQAEHRPWSNYNFKNNNPLAPLMGLQEELGELCLAHINQLSNDGIEEVEATYYKSALSVFGSIFWGQIVHAQLKKSQSIRVNEDHDKNTQESIVKMLKTLRRLDPERFNNSLEVSRVDDQILLPEKKPEVKDSIGDLLIYLAAYANQNDISIQECMETAWNEVKERDWVKYPNTGRPNNGSDS